MRRSLFILLTLCSTGLATAQSAQAPVDARNASRGITTDKAIVVPPATLASVQKATQTLGDHALRGQFGYAIDNMYPRYKKKQEAILGKKINAKELESQTAMSLNKMGVSINSYIAGRPTGVFKVWQQIKPSVKLKLDQGIDVKLKDSDVFQNWMFIVPTTQVWTFMSKKGGSPRKAEIKGYQIVVAQETSVPGQEQWSFIDGAGMTTRELRSVFPSLPIHLVLPTPSKSEIK